jgi:hypothetical protein
VQPVRVVPGLDELEDRATRLGPGLEPVLVDELGLEGGEERLDEARPKIPVTLTMPNSLL